MKTLNFKVIVLTICLIVGILLGYYLKVSLIVSGALTGSFFVALSIIYIIFKKRVTKVAVFGLVTHFTMIFIGMLVVNLHNETIYSSHYIQHQNFQKDSISLLQLKILEALKSGAYNNRYKVKVLSINGKAVSGKALLNINDTLNTYYNIDDLLYVNAQLKPIRAPLNPSQFNYGQYLAHQNIYALIYTEQNAVFKINTNSISVFGYADKLRQTINDKLAQYSFTSNTLAVTNALLLGQRQDINETLYEAYKNAGVLHILAVSGLHVGVILWLLSGLFKPIKRFKYGHIIKTVLLVTLLWGFAIITGLSASVMRAVTMFCFIVIGMNLNRPVNTLNTLALSALVLLLYKPMFLFDVGFQLSYCAVIGIVVIYPMLYRQWQFKDWIPNKIWQAFIIGVGAQLGVLPISLLYFHQFPSLFFIGNIIVIPLLGIILGFGVLVILLALINILPPFLANIYNYIIEGMNLLFSWVAQQEAFILKAISFDITMVCTSYICIIALMQFFMKRDYKKLAVFLITVLLFQSALFYNKYRTETNNQFMVFHKTRFSLIGLQQGNYLKWFHNLDSINKTNNYVLKNFPVENFIKYTTEDILKPFYYVGGETFVLIDSLGIYTTTTLKPNYVLLLQSPHINLNRLIDSLQPKQIIADGSNYKTYINRWKATCKKRKIPFYYTGEKGVFIYKY